MKTLVLGMVQTNCYIIHPADRNEAVVIDPADNADKILQYLKANDLVCKAILLTHGHFDHILAVKELAGFTGAPVFAHEEEVALLSNSRLNASYHIHKECEFTPEVLLKDQEILKIAGMTIKVMHTPGHTAGSVCYSLRESQTDQQHTILQEGGILISGDTLFRESIGRTDLPTGNSSQLVESILTKLMLLEDQVMVFPGHGPSTTIGYERENNIYLAGGGTEFFDL
ncbi:MAG: hypothetical protein K0S76_2494 [Herbinix sp.]|nr:hypothetical protein [Herbinix sp.]